MASLLPDRLPVWLLALTLLDSACGGRDALDLPSAPEQAGSSARDPSRIDGEGGWSSTREHTSTGGRQRTFASTERDESGGTTNSSSHERETIRGGASTQGGTHSNLGGFTSRDDSFVAGATSIEGGSSSRGGTTARSSTTPIGGTGGKASCGQGFMLIAQTPISGPDRPYHAHLDDFDRDGILDLAVSAQPSSTVRTYRGRGDAQFDLRQEFTAPDFAAIVDSTDLDGDGHPELFASTHDSTQLHVWNNLGDGTFVPALEYALAQSPYAIVHGDLNHDGLMDIVVGHDTFAGSYEIGLGTSSGVVQFQAAEGLGARVCGLALADLDGDETLDLVTANLASMSISVLAGSGTGSFERRPEYSIQRGGPVDVKTGDFDRDGRMDLVVADWQHNAVFVLLGDGKGAFSSSTRYDVGADPRSVVVDDFDGNGALDIAAGAFGRPALTLLLGRGDGTFDTKNFEFATGVYFITSGDLNSDGRPDLVLVEPNANQLQILLNLCP
ncbi:MAG: VCBS repeat-containing protein [Polyangiaceae bacterium]